MHGVVQRARRIRPSHASEMPDGRKEAVSWFFNVGLCGLTSRGGGGSEITGGLVSIVAGGCGAAVGGGATYAGAAATGAAACGMLCMPQPFHTATLGCGGACACGAIMGMGCGWCAAWVIIVGGASGWRLLCKNICGGAGIGCTAAELDSIGGVDGR